MTSHTSVPEGKDKEDLKELAEKLAKEISKLIEAEKIFEALPIEERKRILVEKDELLKRSIELGKRQIKRDLITILSLIGVMGSVFTYLLLLAGSFVLSLWNLVNLKVIDSPFQILQIFQFWLFEYPYLFYIIPAIIFLLCYLGYSKMNPDKKDLLYEVSEKMKEKL